MVENKSIVMTKMSQHCHDQNMSHDMQTKSLHAIFSLHSEVDTKNWTKNK